MNKKFIVRLSDEERGVCQEVIKKLLNNKAPGPDGISYEFYKLALPAVMDIFEILFNDILKGATIPTSWTNSYITLIPKKEEIKSENAERRGPTSG